MAQNSEPHFINKGFWNGFTYSVGYPIEPKEIKKTAMELYKGVVELKKGELDRRHTFGFLVGGGINLTSTCLENVLVPVGAPFLVGLMLYDIFK